MSPHALSPPRGSPSQTDMNGFSSGTKGIHTADSASRSHRSHLQPTHVDELHDFICVGFGPGSLAIAIALHDALDSEHVQDNIPKLNGRSPRVAFLERQPGFSWHAGMLLEGAKMQISFIKDMATLRNPRSSFTFLNYLHIKGRLVQFTNLDTFLPQRIEFEDYLRWCASWFDEVVQYQQEVLEIRTEKEQQGSEVIDSFTVVSRNTTTQEITSMKAKHVIIAAGGRATIPQPFPEKHPRLLHSSKYSYHIPHILPDRQAPYHIAVVGSGQSAAEIFNNLHSKYPNASTRLIIKSAALRPSDDSPFVNEIFNPESVSTFYSQSEPARSTSNASNRCTNYGVVRLELLEHTYQTLYMQRIRTSNENEWQHRILTNRIVVGVDSSCPNSLRLSIAHGNSKAEVLTSQSEVAEVLDFDATILATGYTRDIHEKLLKSVRYLLPGGDKQEKKWDVSRDYKVRFEDGMVSDDAGIFLQGCCEETHGLADTLLSILSVRGGEIVKSIFGNTTKSVSSSSNGHARNGLINGIEGLDLGVKNS